MSAFSSRIDNLLTERNYKRADLARGIGVSEATIRMWFRNDSIPSAELAFKVAQFFGVSVEYLVTGNNITDVPQLYLDQTENEIIDIYRALDKRGKNELYKIAQTIDEEFNKTIK